MTRSTGSLLSPAAKARRCGRAALLALVIVTGVSAFNTDAKAIPAVDRDAIIAAAFASSILFPTPATVAAEAAAAAAAWAAYYAERNGVALAIGQAELNSVFPVTFATTGEHGSLTFAYINPVTLLPTTGPTVASVLYEQSQTPNVLSSFVTIGTSTNAGADFALPYTAGLTLGTVEQQILAIPYDSAGSPIVLPGVDGDNSAQGGLTILMSVPEPATLAVLASGLLALTVTRRRVQAHRQRARGSPRYDRSAAAPVLPSGAGDGGSAIAAIA
jgi:hypothetical protein